MSDLIDQYQKSGLISTPRKPDSIRACPYCGEEVTPRGLDAIDYCPECEVITEGETIVRELEE